MTGMTFRELLAAELRRRCRKNRRYSLRAFGRALGVDHSTLSQVMRGGRRLTPRSVLRIAPRLGIPQHEAEVFATEAKLFQAVSRRTFRPRSTELARRLAISVDEANVLLQRMLRTRQLRMTDRGWEIADDESSGSVADRRA
jgi:transcriptional regulator with XRE-family HTH domain